MTGVQTCALPIYFEGMSRSGPKPAGSLKVSNRRRLSHSSQSVQPFSSQQSFWNAQPVPSELSSQPAMPECDRNYMPQKTLRYPHRNEMGSNFSHARKVLITPMLTVMSTMPNVPCLTVERPLKHVTRTSVVALLSSKRSRVRELESGMRQLAGTKTRYRRAHAAPLAGLISGRAKF